MDSAETSLGLVEQ